MSARDLQQAYQAEVNDWRQRGIAGTVSSVDAAGSKLNINVRTPDGAKPLVVGVSPETQFTRYSPASPKTPVPSKLADIQPGDQIRVLGNKTPDGSSVAAEKVYSGSFRTLAGTISSVSPGGNEITVTDLQTKQPVQIALTADSSIRKLPAPLAMMLARRINSNSRSAESANAPPSAGSPAVHVGEGKPQGGPEGAGANSSPAGVITRMETCLR